MVEVTDLEDANYRLLAAKIYEANRETRRFTAQLQADYGRWLITTIAAIHAGGIFLVATMPNLFLSSKRAAIFILVSGLVLIMLSGLATWLNWSSAMQLFDHWSNPRMLTDRSAWPTMDAEAKALCSRLRWTRLGAIGAGLLSILCLPLATAFI